MKNIHVPGLSASWTCESDHYFSAELLLFSSSNCSITMGGGLNREICTKSPSAGREIDKDSDLFRVQFFLLDHSGSFVQASPSL